MSVIQEFTVAPGQTEATFRIQKSAQHLLIKRIASLSIIAAGLLLGLPEKVSAEVSHPARKRFVQGDRVPLSHTSAWAQFGRGPVVEIAPATSLADSGFGEVRIGVANSITTTVHYYLNQSGAVELVSDDQFTITITNLVPGAHYVISAPEMPVLPMTANKLYKYDTSLILANDREKELFVAGFAGLILPNNPAAIERVTFTIVVDDQGTQKEESYPLDELLAVQADANPVVVTMNYTSPNVAARSTVNMTSITSDLLVISLNNCTKVDVQTVLGQEVMYTLIKVADRSEG